MLNNEYKLLDGEGLKERGFNLDDLNRHKSENHEVFLHQNEESRSSYKKKKRM